MDTASPAKDIDQKMNGLSPTEISKHQKHELKSDYVESGSTELRLPGSDHADTKTLTTSAEDDKNVKSKSGRADRKRDAAKDPSRSGRKENKVLNKRGTRYLLRSSLDGVRVLRSMSNGKSKMPANPVSMPVNPVPQGRKKRRKVKRISNDEFSITRKRVRYLLSRMNYEQSLIDAYSGEGWKGQSLEKIRPEKELERAKSEILRCKLKVRNLFQHLDSLISEGKLQESLFDPEGQICSEDIFCAKCGSKDLSSDNDIILCDGICDRGFHQKCLTPPLLSENIPPGDEGWLCPACDCKVDGIDLLNEFQGSEISIEDTWEKIFPEAAAIAAGDKQYDDFGIPSDDSEDNDYDPDVPEVNMEDRKEGSSSEESDFTSSSEDSSASNHNEHYENFGFPSDDSEDDDYDPDGPDLDEAVQKEGLSSDESDFTSDTDDLCAENADTPGANEGSVSSLSNPSPLDHSDEGRCARDMNKSTISSELRSLLEPDVIEENALMASGKRECERLDYKKLYDETYGNMSSDSSGDEDWTDMSTPKKTKKDNIRKETVVLSKANPQKTENRRSCRSAKGKPTGDETVTKSELEQPQVSQELSENTPKRAHHSLYTGAVNHSVAEQHKDYLDPDSNGKKVTTSVRRKLGGMILQRLSESFKENKYPTRKTKESLAEELGIKERQISKWFENARHSLRVSATEPNEAETVTADGSTIMYKTDGNYMKSDKEMRLNNSTSIAGRAKNSSQAENSKVGSEVGIDNGERRKEMLDNDRQKAIARELRKRRMSR